MEKSERGK
jgi:serine/threonine protein kinase